MIESRTIQQTAHLNYVMGFSYRKYDDGELCHFTDEVLAYIDKDEMTYIENRIAHRKSPTHKVKTECSQRANGKARQKLLVTHTEVINHEHQNLNIEHEEWEMRLLHSIEESGLDTEEWEDITFDYVEVV